MARDFRSRTNVSCLAMLVLTGCDGEPNVPTAILSPDGDLTLSVQKSDLGACCANRVRIVGNVFDDKPQQLAEIEGASDVRYNWEDADTLSIVACNATKVTFRSGFQNNNFTRRFILSVENERPEEDDARVLCASERFAQMTPL